MVPTWLILSAKKAGHTTRSLAHFRSLVVKDSFKAQNVAKKHVSIYGLAVSPYIDIRYKHSGYVTADVEPGKAWHVTI